MEKQHDIYKRATHVKLMKFFLALQLYKIHNETNQSDDWMTTILSKILITERAKYRQRTLQVGESDKIALWTDWPLHQ